MSRQDPKSAKTVELSTTSDASAAISRMRSAPAFLSDEDWCVLESTRESALVGNAKGALPESLEEGDVDN